MSNVNPPSGSKVPHRPDPIKELQAASTGASTAVGLDIAIRNFLRQQFGTAIADRICDRAMDSLRREDKIGKNLSFDTVKKAILEAAEKENLAPKELKNLESLFEKDETLMKTEDDPFKFIREAIDTLQRGRTEVEKLKGQYEDSVVENHKEEIDEKRGETKRTDLKKLINPDKLV